MSFTGGVDALPILTHQLGPAIIAHPGFYLPWIACKRDICYVISVFLSVYVSHSWTMTELLYQSSIYFFLSGSPAIIVFLYHTSLQNSDSVVNELVSQSSCICGLALKLN